MSIRFFKVQGVDASTGQMRLKVWVRLTWNLGERGVLFGLCGRQSQGLGDPRSDLRLSWDPADYGSLLW